MVEPKVRFPEFKVEWTKYILSEYLDFKNGLNTDKSNFGSGVAFISVMDILNNQYILYDNIRGSVNINEKTLREFGVGYGDILFQRSSETREDAGKSNVYIDRERVATFGGFVIRGKGKKDYNPLFMNSLLKTSAVRKEIISRAAGAQHINVSQDSLGVVNICIPHINEQNKIADFLSKIDERISVQQSLISNLEDQKKGLMQKLFSQEVRFKADDGSDYPDWIEMTLEDLCDIIGGGTPDTTVNDYWNGDLNWFTPTEIGKTKYVSSSNRKITKEGLKNSSAKYLPVGSILLSTRATLGEMSITMEECSTNQGFQSLVAKEEVLNEFIYYLQNQIKRYCLKNASGSTFLEVSKSSLGKCKLIIPCFQEQKKVVNCLSTFDNKIELEKSILEDWQQIKKGLLQQMFV